ncbi:small multi-drug export protein [Candidatus Peregrinibacteria bacterium]|nr:small multi-drug export protein [Candidatus Peregrinibacteria bacterium]
MFNITQWEFWPQFVTFTTAMIPVIELRGAIPVAIQVFKMPPLEAFFWAALGNMVPNFFLVWLLGPISNFFMEHSLFFKKFLTKIFEKTRAKHSEKFTKYGAIFLVIFIGIPVPGTGSWTGSLIAFLFGIKYWHAMALIALGVMLAGIIVTLGFTSFVNIIEWIIH